MNDETKVTDIEVIEDEPTDGLPNPDLYPEVPMEQKKKAINVEDLVYVRQYIDNRMEEVPGIVREVLSGEDDGEDEDVGDGSGYYTKNETNATFYNKTEIDENFYNKTNADELFYKKTDVYNKTESYNKTEIDDTFYKKTDTVEEAAHADNADTINGIEIKQDDNGVLKIGDVIIPQMKNILLESNHYTDDVVHLSIDDSELNIYDDIEVLVNFYDNNDLNNTIVRNYVFRGHYDSEKIVTNGVRTKRECMRFPSILDRESTNCKQVTLTINKINDEWCASIYSKDNTSIEINQSKRTGISRIYRIIR